MLAPAVVALLVLAAGFARAAGDPPRWHLPPLHAGTLHARDVAREGTEALQRKEDALAARVLADALREDPLLVPAWTNLAAAEIRRCRKDAALFAGAIARRLAPEDAPSAENFKLALTMECPAPAEVTPLERTEHAAYAGGPDAWVAAAAARRAARDLAHAVLYEDIALQSGAERAPALRRVAADLEALGSWREAALAYAEAGASEDAQRVEAARAAREGDVSRALVALDLASADARVAADARTLAEVALARGASVEDATRAAARAVPTLRRTRTSGWWGALSLDPAWSEVQLANAEGGHEPFVLRRAPGDTQLVFASWPAAEGERDTVLARAFAAIAAAPAGPADACPRPPRGAACRRVPVDVAAGFGGTARVLVHVVGPPDEAPWLIVAALAGDAGAGDSGRRAGSQAVDDALAAFELPASRPEPGAHRLRLPIPTAWQADRTHDESKEPWRRALLASGLAIDLPPGIVAGSLAEPAQPAWGPRTCLLLRGRFTDLERVAVTLGSLEWPGWVDVLPDGPAALAARRADPSHFGPRTDPGARFVRAADLGPALAAAGSRNGGLAARFGGGRFGGTWLLFWIASGAELVEIALPVVEGGASASLPWTAITVRREAETGPPAPVDFSARYAVKFTRTAGRESAADPREGRLEAAELQLAVPRGFRVSLNPASPDGFPVGLRGPDGSAIVVERLEPLVAGADLRRAEVEARHGAPIAAWKTLPAPRGLRIDETVFGTSESDPARLHVLLVLPDPPAARAAFRLTFSGASLVGTAGEPLRRLVSSSIRLK